jgi:hypothetical protein
MQGLRAAIDAETGNREAFSFQIAPDEEDPYRPDRGGPARLTWSARLTWPR